MSHTSVSSQRAHSCLVGTTLAMMLFAMAPDRTEAAGTLYWGSGYVLRRASTEGDCRQTILPADNFHPIAEVDVDPKTAKVFFKRFTRIQSCDLDGGNTEVVFAGQPVAQALDIDRVNRKLYWTDEGNRIMRANLDGSNIELVFSGSAPVSQGIAVDPAGGKVYWTQYSFDDISGTIHRANLDGTSHEQIAVSGVVPFGIAVHHASGKVFWSDGDGFSTVGGVYRANLDFSNVENIVSGVPSLRLMDIDEAAGKLYVTSQVSPAFRCDLNGGGLVTLGLGDSWAIACVPEELGFVCLGDTNLDLSVNVEDLLDVIGSWGPCRSCEADFNGDGTVNVQDLLYIVNHWTP